MGEEAESVIRRHTITGDREDSIQVMGYPGVARRTLVLTGNVAAGKGQEANFIRGHQVEISYGGELAPQLPGS